MSAIGVCTGVSSELAGVGVVIGGGRGEGDRRIEEILRASSETGMTRLEVDRDDAPEPEFEIARLSVEPR